MDVNCISEYLTLAQELITASRQCDTRALPLRGGSQCTVSNALSPSPPFGLCLKTGPYNDSLTHVQILSLQKAFLRRDSGST